MNMPLWVSGMMIFTVILQLLVPGLLFVAALLTVNRTPGWVSTLLVVGSCIALLCSLPTVWMNPLFRHFNHASVQAFRSVLMWTNTASHVD